MHEAFETDCGIHVKSWCPNIEAGALDQIYNLARLPFAFHHIAIMPDCHMGYGMPIGGVLATDQNVVIPNAVGVDIGCGVYAFRTVLTADDLTYERLEQIIDIIRSTVPVGCKKHARTPYTYRQLPNDWLCPIAGKHKKNATQQLGTLGGGNHFIEIQKDGEGWVWVMIHSGSRNVGKQIADYYNKVAKELNAAWFSDTQDDLAFLADIMPGEHYIHGVSHATYIREMNWCVRYAQINRFEMGCKVRAALANVFHNRRAEGWKHFPVTSMNPSQKENIDIAHNYAALENHFGKNVMVHRKGATRARAGELGIIPGSQGTKSYIVKGLGNPNSFMSCSHGAGRRMSRKKAKETLDLADQQAIMEGIKHTMTNANDLDEAPGAYKDIDEVMAQQSDLVEIVTELTPIAVIKG